MYSAAGSHSPIVALVPRLSSTGLPVSATASGSGGLRVLRAAIGFDWRNDHGPAPGWREPLEDGPAPRDPCRSR